MILRQSLQIDSLNELSQAHRRAVDGSDEDRQEAIFFDRTLVENSGGPAVNT